MIARQTLTKASNVLCFNLVVNFSFIYPLLLQLCEIRMRELYFTLKLICESCITFTARVGT